MCASLFAILLCKVDFGFMSPEATFSFLTNHVFVGPEVAYCLCSIQFHVLLLKFRGKTRCGYFKRVCLGPWRGYLILILTVLVATATRPTFFFSVFRDSLMRVMSVTPAFSV